MDVSGFNQGLMSGEVLHMQSGKHYTTGTGFDVIAVT
jgi:hypothetical protein